MSSLLRAPPAPLVLKHHQPAVVRVAQAATVGVAEHGKLPRSAIQRAIVTLKPTTN